MSKKLLCLIDLIKLNTPISPFLDLSKGSTAAKLVLQVIQQEKIPVEKILELLEKK